MTNHVKLGWACLLGCALAACGNEEVPGTGDPRCEQICEIELPEYEGVGDVCSASARATCLAECAVRIEGVSTLCASCLLESAHWGPTSDYFDENLFCIPGDECSNLHCTADGPGGTCSFCLEDQDARLACYRTAFPRTETDACQSYYRPVMGCAELCSS